MPDNDAIAFSKIIRKLNRLANLDETDRDAIRALPFRAQEIERHNYVIREGERATQCTILLEGYACRHKTTDAGGRQIVSFHIPSDMLDLQHLFLAQADHSVQMITGGRIAAIPASELTQLAKDRPTIAEALWRDTLIDASIFREWVLNVGRRTALQRVAHMLCEFAARREAEGLGSPERFEFPMSQEIIADATGLTSVHVNRMLSELGKAGVIVRDKREVEITDWSRMRRVADFDAAYLHLVS